MAWWLKVPAFPFYIIWTRTVEEFRNGNESDVDLRLSELSQFRTAGSLFYRDLGLTQTWMLFASGRLGGERLQTAFPQFSKRSCMVFSHQK